MTLENIKERTFKNKYEDNYVSKILKDNMKVVTVDKPARYKLPCWRIDPMDDESNVVYMEPQKPGRPYIFKIENFLTLDELTKIGYNPENDKENELTF